MCERPNAKTVGGGLLTAFGQLKNCLDRFKQWGPRVFNQMVPIISWGTFKGVGGGGGGVI